MGGVGGERVCFIFLFLFFLCSSGETSTKRIELKLSLVVAVQYSKTDLGYHDFHDLRYFAMKSQNVSPGVYALISTEKFKIGQKIIVLG